MTPLDFAISVLMEAVHQATIKNIITICNENQGARNPP